MCCGFFRLWGKWDDMSHPPYHDLINVSKKRTKFLHVTPVVPCEFAMCPWSAPSYQRHCCETRGCHSVQDIQVVNRSRRPGAPRSKCAEPSHPGIQAPTTDRKKSANLRRRADHVPAVSSASGWSHDFNPSTEPSEPPRPSRSTHFPPVWRYTPPGPPRPTAKKVRI